MKNHGNVPRKSNEKQIQRKGMKQKKSRSKMKKKHFEEVAYIGKGEKIKINKKRRKTEKNKKNRKKLTLSLCITAFTVPFNPVAGQIHTSRIIVTKAILKSSPICMKFPTTKPFLLSLEPYKYNAVRAVRKL